VDLKGAPAPGLLKELDEIHAAFGKAAAVIGCGAVAIDDPE